MGKVIVALLATCMVCWLAFRFVGASMASTAVTVPATSHTAAFPITWMLALAVVGGIVIWRTVKG